MLLVIILFFQSP